MRPGSSASRVLHQPEPDSASSAISHAASAASISRRIMARRAVAAVTSATRSGWYIAGSASLASIRARSWPSLNDAAPPRLSRVCATARVACAPRPARAGRPCGSAPHRRRTLGGRAPQAACGTRRDRRRNRPDRAVRTSHSRSATSSDQMRVVGDQQHRALEIGQRLHQRLARIDVEMVGRLVQDQQMRRVARHQREQQPRLLAAGEGLRPVSARSASSPNRASCARSCGRRAGSARAM